jgi:hypothetical protein
MQRLRTVALGVLLGGFAFNSSGAGCFPQSDFQCATTEDCVAQGAGGICEPNSFCSFPDAACPGSMRRWDDRASDSIAGDCVDAGATATDTDTDGSSSEEGSTTQEPEEMTSSSTMPVEPASSSGMMMTTDPMTSSGSGEPTSTGDPGAACTAMYGAATDYMFCEDLGDSCRFSTTIGMTMSCNDVCTAGGGTCVGAELNDVELCTSTGAGTCDQLDVTDIICVCSL